MIFTNLPWVIIAAGLLVPSALSAVVPRAIPYDICPSPIIVSEQYIGENQDVKVQVIQCDTSIAARDTTQLSKRQANVCGATCMSFFSSPSFILLNYDLVLGNTNCFTPSGGGPDPNECHVIADALRYDSQNIGTSFKMYVHVNPKRTYPVYPGDSFTMVPANNTALVTMQYRSCSTFIVDQANVPLSYCRSAWVCLP